MNEKPSSFELKEPTSPEAFVPASWVEPWMVFVFILLVLLVLAYFAFKKKRSPLLDPTAARRVAYTEATSALASIGDVIPREAAVQCSLILRRYLSVVANDPALFETHEEYLSRHEALKNFSEEARGSAALGFARLAALKYSPGESDMDTPQVILGSKSLLDILNNGMQA